jgi:hypothetical protein
LHTAGLAGAKDTVFLCDPLVNGQNPVGEDQPVLAQKF